MAVYEWKKAWQISELWWKISLTFRTRRVRGDGRTACYCSLSLFSWHTCHTFGWHPTTPRFHQDVQFTAVSQSAWTSCLLSVQKTGVRLFWLSEFVKASAGTQLYQSHPRQWNTLAWEWTESYQRSWNDAPSGIKSISGASRKEPKLLSCLVNRTTSAGMWTKA